MRSWTLPGYVYEGSPAEEEQAMISLIHFDPLAGSVSWGKNRARGEEFHHLHVISKERRLQDFTYYLHLKYFM